MTVQVIDHPAGALMRIECDGGIITLDRDEAWQLFLELQAKLGQMPVKIGAREEAKE
jgi:hypothetical protein